MVTHGSSQARGYAVQICILLKNVQNLELVDSKEFPPLKILTAKTVGRYIAINEKIGVDEVEDESRVKKTPPKKVASRKRPAAAVDEPVVKKKRTRVGKAAVVANDSALVSVAQEAVPLQVVEPITAAQPPKLKRKAPKRKLKLPQGSEDEPVAKDADVGDVEKQSVGEQQLQTFDETASRLDASTDYFVIETIAGMKIADVIPTVKKKPSADEAMTLEEILLTIPDGCSLPSTIGEVTNIQLGRSISIPGVDEGDWYKATLPKILAADKGKAPLLERDPIKGIPPKEIFSLILANINLLVQLHEKVIDEAMDEQLATIWSEMLEFRAQEKEMISTFQPNMASLLIISIGVVMSKGGKVVEAVLSRLRMIKADQVGAVVAEVVVVMVAVKEETGVVLRRKDIPAAVEVFITAVEVVDKLDL
ncbi:hypothetical protein F511_02157 [Dorcoceras hygrometricum]|uniref:Splicing factor 3B subunit 1-like n=1 Tax=Dorcoceras hygrometricum TaxID=472368 RepID=A0A2Z7B2E3_9LAMI|nr:hypothetical protein F511_02157 [Dorcoceras hygrometricum]